jgi:hypothetical protein
MQRRSHVGDQVVVCGTPGDVPVAHPWTFLAGEAASKLQPIGSLDWAGFEAATAVNSTGPKFSAVAVDSKGKELGRSFVVYAPAGG